MDLAFWKERWDARQIGFHEDKPNELLAQHTHLLAGRKRVLVPLAGKSLDMLLLASLGLEVVGVEAVEAPCREFFEDNGVDYRVVRGEGGDRFTRFAGGGVTLVCGDMFACTRVDLGAFDAVYDRAALVALEPSTRRRYVDTVLAMLEPAARTLLISFTYDQSKVGGPPWSIDDAAVRALYEPAARVELVVTNAAELRGKIAAAGVRDVRESLYCITHP